MRLQKIFSYDLEEKYKQAAVLVASGTGRNHADLTSCVTLFFTLLVMIYKRLKTLNRAEIHWLQLSIQTNL